MSTGLRWGQGMAALSGLDHHVGHTLTLLGRGTSFPGGHIQSKVAYLPSRANFYSSLPSLAQEAYGMHI